jgi:hypothetical protein
MWLARDAPVDEANVAADAGDGGGGPAMCTRRRRRSWTTEAAGCI